MKTESLQFHVFAVVRRKLSLLFLVLQGALVSSGGMATCNQTPCTPGNPNYNPLTGLCTTNTGGDGLGPALPGSGNLPSEPGTPTPTTQPDPNLPSDSVDLNIYGLGGQWMDNGRRVCINHTGGGVFANYYDAYSCDPQDGTPPVETFTDFEAQLNGNMLTGTTSVCAFGHSDPADNGIKETAVTLTVSDDGKTLSGSWFDPDKGMNVPIVLTRTTVGDCHTQ